MRFAREQIRELRGRRLDKALGVAFNGRGTNGMGALELARRYMGIDLTPEYIQDVATPRIQQRLAGVPPKERAAGQLSLGAGADAALDTEVGEGRLEVERRGT